MWVHSPDSFHTKSHHEEADSSPALANQRRRRYLHSSPLPTVLRQHAHTQCSHIPIHSRVRLHLRHVSVALSAQDPPGGRGNNVSPTQETSNTTARIHANVEHGTATQQLETIHKITHRIRVAKQNSEGATWVLHPDERYSAPSLSRQPL